MLGRVAFLCKSYIKNRKIHQVVLSESCGRVEDRIEQTRRVKDTTRRPTKSTNLGPLGLRDGTTNQKSMQGLDLGPLHICSLVFMWVP